MGEVLASRSADVAVGTHVLHGRGWREHTVLAADRATVVDTDAAPASRYLGLLGLTGLTAYVGLTAVAEMREADTVFVSGAAGAVGQAAGQIATALGAKKVTGSAGAASSATTRPSTTGRHRSGTGSAKPRPRASTSPSTTSAATTSRRRSVH